MAMLRYIGLRCPPDRDWLIRSHLDAAVGFAPSSPGLEPKYRRGNSARSFAGGNAEQVASDGHVRVDGIVIKLIAVMTPETFGEFYCSCVSRTVRLGLTIPFNVPRVPSRRRGHRLGPSTSPVCFWSGGR